MGKMNHVLPGNKGLKENLFTTVKKFYFTTFQGVIMLSLYE